MTELVGLVMVGGTSAIPASVCGRRAFLLSHSSAWYFDGRMNDCAVQSIDEPLQDGRVRCSHRFAAGRFGSNFSTSNLSRR